MDKIDKIKWVVIIGVLLVAIMVFPLGCSLVRGEEIPVVATNGKYPLHPSITYPQAYYYNDKTYVVWQGDVGFHPYIDCYDHSTETWHGAVKVGDNPLGESDTHGTPAVIIDASGFIHVFWGTHNTVIKHARSTNPESISAWTAQGDISGRNTYINIIKADDGCLWMVTRTLVNGSGLRNSISYRVCTDWNTSYEIIRPDAGDTLYLGNIAYDSINERVHISWCYYDAFAKKRLNIYHAYLNMSNGKMYSMSVRDLGTQISTSEANKYCRVINSGSYQTNTPALHLDSTNYPYILFSIDDNGWKHKMIRWDGGLWDLPQTIVASGHQHSYADFIIHSPSSIDAYLTISVSGKESGTLEKWNWNACNWFKVKTIITEKATNYDGVNSVNLVVDGTDAIRAIFGEVHVAGYLTTYDLNIYAIDSNDEFLGGS